MITDLFTIENKKIKPTLHCYLIPEFKQILDKYEARGVDMLTYAFYYACPFKSINPYADFNDDEREERLKKSFVIFPDNPDVLLAIETMKSLYDTTSMKYFNMNRKNLHDIMDYLETSVISDGKEGNLQERLRIAEKCAKIKAEFDDLEKNVEAERGKMKARGQRQIGLGEL
ncbi:MAG: hypothetical protein KC414_13490 [Romboutsia sp.]|nr:hypothetical protein [Romboutsia sp.]